MRRFNIVVPRDDGGVEVHPMKEWLRRHPEHLPGGMNASSATSHQLRNGLSQRGWEVEELPEEVRLFMPGHTAGAAVDALLGSGVEEEADASVAFGLEAQLRDFIAHNLKSIPIAGQVLRLYVDAGGRDGVEYPTEVGVIDILAQAPQGGFFVFELKLERGPDRALGQLARYMGWVQLKLAGAPPVHGVIVARTIDEKLRYAASVIPSVTLLEYDVEFRVREAKVEGRAG
jgi:hypothetical protein